MIVVAVDSEMHGQFIPLEYASDELFKLREHLINKKFPKIYSQLQQKLKSGKIQFNSLNPRVKIEETLKVIFSKDKYIFPLAKWSTLYDFFFNELRLHFSEALSMTLDRLQKDLAGGGANDDLNYINLKELRDQILGERMNTNIVFGWGLDDERLCQESRA